MPTNINAKVNGKVRTRQDKQNKQQQTGQTNTINYKSLKYKVLSSRNAICVCVLIQFWGAVCMRPL